MQSRVALSWYATKSRKYIPRSLPSEALNITGPVEIIYVCRPRVYARCLLWNKVVAFRPIWLPVLDLRGQGAWA
jgi:hypothetical protein